MSYYAIFKEQEDDNYHLKDAVRPHVYKTQAGAQRAADAEMAVSGGVKIVVISDAWFDDDRLIIDRHGRVWKRQFAPKLPVHPTLTE